MIEPEVIARCLRGDRKAQQEVYARTSDRIYRLALRITGHGDDASEVTQETYVRAFTRLSQFDGRSSLLTWLYRIAINEALQLQRRENARAAHESAAAAMERPRSDESAEDTRLDIESGLASLPPTDRAILLLRYQEGLDYQTIAEITECEPGTVGSRLNRARQRLRAFLKTGYAARQESAVREHPMSRELDESTGPELRTSEADIGPGTGP